MLLTEGFRVDSELKISKVFFTAVEAVDGEVYQLYSSHW